MGQPDIVQNKRQWYLIASYGDVVMRVHPGMPLGETAAGELSFDPSCAQVELNIADDGGLLLSAVESHELESAGGTRCRQEHLARHCRAEIRLPHNTLRIDTDFVNLPPTDDTVKILAVRLTEDKAKPQIGPNAQGRGGDPLEAGDPLKAIETIETIETTDAIEDALVVARPPQRTTSRSTDLAGTSAADTPSLEANHVIAPPRWAPGPPESDAQTAVQTAARTAGDISAYWRTERTGTSRPRILSPFTAVLIGLAGVALTFLYLAVREGPVPEPSATVSADPAPPTASPTAAASAPSADAEGSGSGAAALPSAVPISPLPLPLPAVDAPPRTGPDGREAVADRRAEQSPEPRPVAVPVIEPIVLPSVERRSIPPIAQSRAQTGGQTVGAAETGASPETVDSQPDATLLAEPVAETVAEQVQVVEPVAEPAEISESAQALAAEQARQRSLVAADRALAQDRLMIPPEASAYTLYNRVLALDPESPEARRGLQSVRQGLINRALAQLAGDALEDARATLQAAADAGANPLLVADLRREVDYRQQLINARDGARRAP